MSAALEGSTTGMGYVDAATCDAKAITMEMMQVTMHLWPISWRITSTAPEQQITVATVLMILPPRLGSERKLGALIRGNVMLGRSFPVLVHSLPARVKSLHRFRAKASPELVNDLLVAANGLRSHGTAHAVGGSRDGLEAGRR
jgi:hypothetical protein